MEGVNVGLLGCTGAVGQRFVHLLRNHKFFRLVALAASEKSAGKRYVNACNWRMDGFEIPEEFKDLVVRNCTPKEFEGQKIRIVFSALTSDVAGVIEEEFAKAGFAVFSNASSHRRDLNVPLVVPLVNPSHLQAVCEQPWFNSTNGSESHGFIITNANCSTTGLVVVLKALHTKHKIEEVRVTSLQAVSGAGFNGVSSMQILDNIIPFISGEEEKLEWEPNKILGQFNSATKEFENENIRISAMCNRVAVMDGHTLCISLKFRRTAHSTIPSTDEVKTILRDYQTFVESLTLPSYPKNPIVVMEEKDRPQPRLDRDKGNGFSVVVGRIREDTIDDVKMVILSHNTVLGAAGSSVLNAEIMFSKYADCLK